MRCRRGGSRAVEQLRQVFAELQFVPMRDYVSFHMAWGRFDESGYPRKPVQCDTSNVVMLDHLAWWASALRTARTADAVCDEGKSAVSYAVSAIADTGAGR
jgi:NAD(P)H-dependent FMN reductase